MKTNLREKLVFFKLLNQNFLILLIALFVLIANSGQGVILIPLGVNCAVASVLRHYKLRIQSLPFDWITTDHEGMCKILKNNFADFLNPNQLILDTMDLHLIDSTYQIKFVHDFLLTEKGLKNEEIDLGFLSQQSPHPTFLEEWKEVNEKYQRRIQRYRNILADAALTKEKTIFIREGYITKNQAIEMQNVLKNCYPDLNFELVIFSLYEEENYPWQIPGIINHYTFVTNFQEEEFLNRKEWKELLLELDLL